MFGVFQKFFEYYLNLNKRSLILSHNFIHRRQRIHTPMEPADQNTTSNLSTVSNQDERQEKDSETTKKEDKPKLKILAFHGYRQNGAVFRSKIGSFRKAVSKYAQLTFVSAPHKVVSEDGAADDGNFIFYSLLSITDKT